MGKDDVKEVLVTFERAMEIVSKLDGILFDIVYMDRRDGLDVIKGVIGECDDLFMELTKLLKPCLTSMVITRYEGERVMVTDMAERVREVIEEITYTGVRDALVVKLFARYLELRDFVMRL